MKILFLADPGSAHTIKWVTSLSKKGIGIFLFGLSNYNNDDYKGLKNFDTYSAKFNPRIFNHPASTFFKLSYLKSIPKLKKIIKDFKPDIVHAHYATSYGLLAALTNFHPFIISVYGSDVFNFPRKNIFFSFVFKFNLSKSDKILSSSNVMATEIKKYSSKEIKVIPFGIDVNRFKQLEVDGFFSKEDIVIGTIKALEENYGIKYLILAFKSLKEKYSNVPLKLLIVGKGSQGVYLKKFVEELNINNDTVFAGYINPQEIPKYHTMVDIFVTLSIEESFGVSVLEASACEKPVVVSNIGGLPEIVENDVTGFVVEKENPEAAAAAIEKLILDPELRKQMGANGRKRVEKLYNWNDNVDQMIIIYSNILNQI